MSEYVTDPALLAQLEGADKEKPKKEDGYIDNPELLAQLNKTLETAPAEGPVAPDEPSGIGAVAPALMNVAQGPTGMKELGQAVKAGASPYVSGVGEGLKKTAEIYKARPIMAPLIDAAGVATMGIPPIAAGQQAMGMYDKYNALKSGAAGVSQELSKGQATKDAYNAMQRALYANDPTGFRDTLRSSYGAPTNGPTAPGAGNNAVRPMLNTPEAKAAMKANPEFAAAAQAYLKSVPTYGEQAMKVVSPFLKGAAKMAGPVGMAANLYEAAPYLEKAGPELTSGAAQNRMAQAQNMMLSRPTPQALTPEEANNLLQSDDARTINIYGGRTNLEALVKSGIRQKAASKVLGPVAPGPQ